jgi:hypothetical protein
MVSLEEQLIFFKGAGTHKGKPAGAAGRLADGGGQSGVPLQVDIEGLFPIRERPLSHAGGLIRPVISAPAA